MWNRLCLKIIFWDSRCSKSWRNCKFFCPFLFLCSAIYDKKYSKPDFNAPLANFNKLNMVIASDQVWARSIGEASPISTENRDRDFFFVLISTKIEIGIFFSSWSRFCIEIGEPEPPRKVGIKVGINRGQISTLLDFFGKFPRKVGIKVGINRGQISTLPDF